MISYATHWYLFIQNVNFQINVNVYQISYIIMTINKLAVL